MTTRVPSARVVIGVVVFALTALTGASAGAQARATTGDLSGVVRDQSNAVVPGATVTATNPATGVERAGVTGRDGRYSIAALPPATYSITVTAAGFAPRAIDNVALAVGQAADVSVTLALAGATESVTIAAQDRLADVTETALATVITQNQIDSLPTNGRSFLSFSLLAPGVNSDRVPVMAVTPTSGLTFAGQRARSNNITVDGLDNNDVVSGSVRAAFSQEAVQEFQVLANSFSAEFGKASGGVVNIVTRSGGNKVAGTLFGYFRDEALNAKEHFETFDPAGGRLDRSKAPYRQQQFGGVLGGPIRRNRAFFFLSVERLKVRANNDVNIPSDIAMVFQQAGFPVELGQVPYRFEADQWLGKIDWNLSPNHRLALRVNGARLLDENAEPWGGLVARSRGASLDSRDAMGAALLTSTLSRRTVNELRLQVAYRDQHVMSLDPRCTGACDQDDEGGPAVDVGAIKVGRSGTTPHPLRTLSYYVVDTLTHQVGRHGLKAGFDVGYVGLRNTALPFAFGGRYIFGPLGPLTDLQAFALGRPYAYVQGYGNPSAPHGLIASDLSLFAEDEWRVRDRLTLKLGLRYQDQFFPRLTESVYGLEYDWPGDHDNLAPRIGVSWDPTGRGTTSVHGAYGVFYDNQIEGISAVVGILRGTGDHVRVKIRPYPESIAGWNAPGRRLQEPTTPYASIMSTVDPRLATPFAHHASAGLERVLAPGLSVAAHAVFVRGFDQVGILEYNPITRPPGGRPLDVNGVPGTSSSVQQYTSWGESWYRGLTLSARKRFGRRSEVLASYTVSKAEDLASDTVSQVLANGLGRNPADPTGWPLGFNPDLERGPSLQDQRHRVVISGTWSLPRGFTASAIVTAGSGRPFNIVAGEDLNGDGDTGGTDRPRTVDGTPVRRNTGLLPGTSSVDVRVAKQVRMGARASLVLMAEIFNLFNHTNYTQVDAVFGGGTYPSNPAPHFGEYTKAAPPFQAQLAAKVSF